MDIGDYYSQSIKGFTKNPLLGIQAVILYFIIYAIVNVTVIYGMIDLFGINIMDYTQSTVPMMNTPDLGAIWTFFGIMIIAFVISWIISCIMSVTTIGMSKRIVLGEKPDLGVALKYVKKYLLKLLAVNIIFVIFNFIAVIPLLVGVILITLYSNSALSIIGLVIGGLITLILFILVYLFFIFTFQSVIVCKKSIIGSFKDSFKSVKNNFFEVLVVLIINLLISVAIGFVVGLISAFIGIIPIIGFILSALITVIVSGLMFAYFTLVLNYLYMDIKNMIPEKAEYGY